MYVIISFFAGLLADLEGKDKATAMKGLMRYHMIIIPEDNKKDGGAKVVLDIDGRQVLAGIVLYFFCFNPLRAKFFRKNINIYLHFMSFLHINKTEVVEIPPRVRLGPAYST